jgi:hypothetical protein
VKINHRHFAYGFRMSYKIFCFLLFVFFFADWYIVLPIQLELSYLIQTLFVLEAFAFLSNFDPSSPFIAKYLTTEKHFSQEQVYSRIYPFWTYSYFAALVLLALFAESLGDYRPVIVAATLAGGLGNCALLLWGNSLALMRLDQALVGVGFAGVMIFLSYSYHVVTVTHYQRLVRSVSFPGHDTHVLWFLSLSLLCWFPPPPSCCSYFLLLETVIHLCAVIVHACGNAARQSELSTTGYGDLHACAGAHPSHD